MKDRICRLAIKANQEIDVFDLKEVLDLVPEDTKIWGFERSYQENASFILLENEAFKEVDMGEVVPRVDIFEDEDGSFTADFSEVMEEKTEWAITNADGTRWKCDFEYFQDECADHFESASITTEKIREAWEKVKNYKIHPKNPGEMFIATTPTGNDWAEHFKAVPFNGDPTATVEWDVAYIDETIEEECQHEWKSYMGLSESFEYCTKCDEKRK